MESNKVSIPEIAKDHATMTVKSLALAQSMNLVSTEEDLTNLIAAGIETALEDFLILLKETETKD
jgi:uncharacterized Rmd1/YagE family protein